MNMMTAIEGRRPRPSLASESPNPNRPSGSGGGQPLKPHAGVRFCHGRSTRNRSVPRRARARAQRKLGEISKTLEKAPSGPGRGKRLPSGGKPFKRDTLKSAGPQKLVPRRHRLLTPQLWPKPESTRSCPVALRNSLLFQKKSSRTCWASGASGRCRHGARAAVLCCGERHLR